MNAKILIAIIVVPVAAFLTISFGGQVSHCGRSAEAVGLRQIPIAVVAGSGIALTAIELPSLKSPLMHSHTTAAAGDENRISPAVNEATTTFRPIPIPCLTNCCLYATSRSRL